MMTTNNDSKFLTETEFTILFLVTIVFSAIVAFCLKNACTRDLAWIREEVRLVFYGVDETIDELIYNAEDVVCGNAPVSVPAVGLEIDLPELVPDEIVDDAVIEVGDISIFHREPVKGMASKFPVGVRDYTPVKISNHRRLPHANKGKALGALCMELKLKFGTPVDNEANRKAIQRTAVDICKKMGMRPSAINSIVFKAIEYTLIANAHQLEAKMVANSNSFQRIRDADKRHSHCWWNSFQICNPRSWLPSAELYQEDRSC